MINSSVVFKVKTIEKLWFFIILTRVFASILMPILEFLGYGKIYMVIKAFLHLFCHQLTYRNINFYEYPLGICNRCFSFYISLAFF